LRGTVVPSTEIIFEWAHDPVGDDTRCYARDACAALALLAANSSSFDMDSISISNSTWGTRSTLTFNSSGTNRAISGDGSISGIGSISGAGAISGDVSISGLECGWARERDYPCLPPNVFSWTYVAGMLTIVLGTILYSSVFVRWRFR